MTHSIYILAVNIVAPYQTPKIGQILSLKKVFNFSYRWSEYREICVRCFRPCVSSYTNCNYCNGEKIYIWCIKNDLIGKSSYNCIKRIRYALSILKYIDISISNFNFTEGYYHKKDLEPIDILQCLARCLQIIMDFAYRKPTFYFVSYNYLNVDRHKIKYLYDDNDMKIILSKCVNLLYY